MNTGESRNIRKNIRKKNGGRTNKPVEREKIEARKREIRKKAV